MVTVYNLYIIYIIKKVLQLLVLESPKSNRLSFFFSLILRLLKNNDQCFIRVAIFDLVTALINDLSRDFNFRFLPRFTLIIHHFLTIEPAIGQFVRSFRIDLFRFILFRKSK